jgi:hypothetical protein
MHPALSLLIEAYSYAQSLDTDVWNFAVELDRLRAAGLTNSALRWLVGSGYVEHAAETTLLGEPCRSFRPLGRFTLTDQTCAVLTGAGARLIRTRYAEECGWDQPSNGAVEPEPEPAEALGKPCWDGARRELSLGGQLVKHFRQPAVAQETILAVFEEDGWPPRIDDPLPHRPEQEPTHRLQNTIKSLNRHQLHHLIQFRGDGTGRGVRWLLLPAASVRAAPAQS